MNIRTTTDAGGLSPELAAAIGAAIGAFLSQEPARSTARRGGISAWRRIAHATFIPGSRGWRGHD